MVQAGVDVVKNKICEGVDDAKKKDAEKKDDPTEEQKEAEKKVEPAMPELTWQEFIETKGSQNCVNDELYPNENVDVCEMLS